MGFLSTIYRRLLASYAILGMRDRYIDPEGDNANDGSLEHPWKDHEGALLHGSNKDCVWVANGTYAINSASGFFSLQGEYDDQLMFRPLSSSPDITITGASGAFEVLQEAAVKNIVFVGHKFTAREGTTNPVLNLYGNNYNTSGLIFDNCTFTGLTTSASVINLELYNAVKYSVEFRNCTFSQPNTTATRPAIKSTYGNCAAGRIVDIVLRDCSVISSNTAVQSLGHRSLLIEGGNYQNTGGYSVITGYDLAVASPVFTYNTIIRRSNKGPVTLTATTVSGHTVLIGQGSQHTIIDGAHIIGGNDTLVIKGRRVVDGSSNPACPTSNVWITSCVIDNGGDGFGPPVLFKGCDQVYFYNNTVIVNGDGTHLALLCYDGDAYYKVSNLWIYNNVVICLGASKALYLPTAGDFDGTIYCDYNCYSIQGTGNLGVAIGTSNIANLAALQSAWSTYGTRDNDSHSIVGNHVDANYKPDSTLGYGSGEPNCRRMPVDYRGKPKRCINADGIGAIF